uniref:Rho GTPase activating protein 44 n=1 Tax=Hippocampus comes TaxID=109280 RepID=A0A3Q2XV09_HIPCM
MKKQFNRMRQLANQTVGRAEKTEVFSEDLLQVEKRLDLVKQVTHGTHKRLTACLQGQQGLDAEKKSKKLPLTILAQSLVEGAAVLGDDSLLGMMLKMCGETEEKLAQELMDFELQIERDVVEPLYALAERPKSQQSSKSSGHPSALQPGAKSESLREEMEEAATRMEICRDQLSADMYGFVAKEMDYATYFQTLIETQAEYHRKSLEILNSILPQIKAHQEAWAEKPSFGKSLGEHLNISGREIAFPIEACVTMLLECGMQEEGLFRVAPSASKLKKLKASLDCGVLDAQEYSSDPHAIAGALKSYLRELPEPLMTAELYDEWIQASNIQDMDKRLRALMAACDKLPMDNFNNLRYLVKFLAKLSEYQDANKMTPGNMAIVLGPNLLWTHTEPDMTEMMTTLSLQIVGIIEPIIQHADWFFPGEMEFNLTGSYGSPVHANHNSNYSSMPSPDMEQLERKQPHHDQSRRPLSVATDNMMLEFYKKDGIRKIQSMGVRVMDTSWVSRKGSSTAGRASPRQRRRRPPPLPPRPRRSTSIPTPSPAACTSPSTARPATVRVPPRPTLTHRRSTSNPPRCSPATSRRSATPLVLFGSLSRAVPSVAVTGIDAVRFVLPGSKKLAPVPPKVPYCQPGATCERSAGQPSPVSLSPTPPSTPSPYGLLCGSPGQLLAPSSPAQTPLAAPRSLSSPPSLTGTLTKARPAPKPRQRPSLPPPQPPSIPVGFAGQAPPPPPPPEQGLADGPSPGESMSTGKHQTRVAPLRPSLRLAVALSNRDGGRV